MSSREGGIVVADGVGGGAKPYDFGVGARFIVPWHSVPTQRRGVASWLGTHNSGDSPVNCLPNTGNLSEQDSSINESTHQRINASTHQRINASTHQRTNPSTAP
ncbi:MAG: hypothetical protein RQ723_02535, partial [Desulfuromonadales bacterium]|nr:hypothetical protein [Desulfuromonadales bacterium]